MTQPTIDSAIAQAVALLSHYGFEIGGYKAEELVAQWLENYQATWIRLAVIEALYQGRYKAVSVEQILNFWCRRGQPTFHFNHDFERLICRKLPRNLAKLSKSSPESLEEDYGSVFVNSVVSDFQTQPSRSPPASEATLIPAANSVFEDHSEASIDPYISVLEPLSEDQEEPRAAEDSAGVRKVIPRREALVPYEGDWSRCEVYKHPIDQFTPPPDGSGFYLRLKAVAQQGAEDKDEG